MPFDQPSERSVCGDDSLPGQLAEAIHASSNAPVNYFNAPAEIGDRRYWDGAIGGYNNPVLAGVIEAAVNAERYGTSLSEIKALSLGTGSVVLPLAQGAPGDFHVDRPDRRGWESVVDLQLSTFSGTNVRRNGSVWPSAISRPSRS